MVTAKGARSECARPLFEYLAASRPGRPEGGRASAIGMAVGIHVVALTLALWATLAAHPALGHVMVAEHEVSMDLLPPSVLLHAREASDGRAPVAERAAADAHAWRKHALDPASLAQVRAQRVSVRVLLETPPPAIPTDVPPPTSVLASLDQPEYDYGSAVPAASYSAAQIVADHHDATADELAAAPPKLVMYTEPPQLSNVEFVRRRLSNEYPDYLQDQGIGGRVVLWFLVDENGIVRKFMMKQSSGIRALDRAALKVASLMRFRPAVNYDRHVAVWVALPVYFQTVEAAG